MSKFYQNCKTWILSEGDYFYGWPKTDHVWSRVCRKYIFARKAGQKCKIIFPFSSSPNDQYDGGDDGEWCWYGEMILNVG